MVKGAVERCESHKGQGCFHVAHWGHRSDVELLWGLAGARSELPLFPLHGSQTKAAGGRFVKIPLELYGKYDQLWTR